MSAPAVRSLYRRCLRTASYCIESQRSWMSSYVRMKFRDEALLSGTLQRRLLDGEDELERMLLTLQRTGRLPTAGPPHRWIARSLEPQASSCASSPSTAAPISARVEAEPRVVPADAVAGPPASASSGPSGAPRHWSEAQVHSWLGELELERHAEAFAKHKIDGQMLFELDDQDLREELQVSSRLARKRILASIASLREGSS